MSKTEQNVKLDSRVEVLAGTRQVAGATFDAVKAKFARARAALVVKVEKVEPQL